MAWTTYMVTILRHLVSDLDSTNYRYTDARLQTLISIAAGKVMSEGLTFDNVYATDITVPSISPDPTTADPKDEGFINLTTLKAACIIDEGEARYAAIGGGLAVSDGGSSFDTRGKLSGRLQLAKDGYCQAYKEAKKEYILGNRSPGKAIMGPFTLNNSFRRDYDICP